MEEADVVIYLFEADGSTEEAVEFIRRNESSMESFGPTQLLVLLDSM